MRITKEIFLEKTRNPKYDFSNINFVNMTTPIEVVCFYHGLFRITPAAMYYQGQGCALCAIERMAKTKALTKQEFIKRAQKVHGDKYDYSLVEYKNNKTKVKIICPIHGVFEQLPINHLKGFGCCACGHIKTTQRRFGTTPSNE
jgi:hypothetical protein